MQPIMNIASDAARAAGDIILRNMDQLDRIKIGEKSENDFFSDIDVKAEQTIIHHIHKAYPQHGIIAEESGNYNEDAETVWIIDPLDGTSNYLHGFPFFCVSIAIRVKNRIEHGIVYDPIRHESFSASRGYGARMNTRRIRVSSKTQLQSSLLATGFPVRQAHLAGKFIPAAEKLFGNCAGVRRTGSAALDLAYVASGRLDGIFEFGLRLWDLAAGTLLIKEAGGMVGDFEGGEKYLKSGNIIAANPKLFKALTQSLSPVLR
ncbi:MAG: inositol monophosphatase [Legionellaceae bacterium]|nr:inositol monophosphatase [Legionellaceae bacterium]